MCVIRKPSCSWPFILKKTGHISFVGRGPSVSFAHKSFAVPLLGFLPSVGVDSKHLVCYSKHLVGYTEGCVMFTNG